MTATTNDRHIMATSVQEFYGISVPCVLVNGYWIGEVKIPPDLARQIAAESVENNFRKRLKPKTIASLRRDMRACRFDGGVNELRADSGGKLTDGRHRLSTQGELGLTISHTIKFGVDSEFGVDEGASRTLRDHLVAHGFKNASNCASAGLGLLQWCRPQPPEAMLRMKDSPDASIAEAVAFCLEHRRRLQDAVAMIKFQIDGDSVASIFGAKLPAAMLCRATMEYFDTPLMCDVATSFRDAMLSNSSGAVFQAAKSRIRRAIAQKAPMSDDARQYIAIFCWNSLVMGDVSHERIWGVHKGNVKKIRLLDCEGTDIEGAK